MRSYGALERRTNDAARRGACVAAVLAAACAGGAASGDGGSPTGAATDVAAGCVVARTPLTAGVDTFVYVEPEDLLKIASGFLVVGTPTYTWAPGTDGDSLPVTAGQHVAARFGLDGRATLIERPVQDSIGSVRALPLGSDRWGVLFDIAWATPPDPVSRTLALWYAEHDGAGWSLLETLPTPEGARLDLHSSTELVRLGEELAWVTVARRPDGRSRVLEYRRSAGSWRSEVVSEEWVESSSLASEGDSVLWLAHYATDASFPDFRKSVRLYRRAASEWEPVSRVADFPGSTLLADLAVRVRPGGVELTWRVESATDDGAYAAVGLGRAREGARLDLDRRVLQVLPLEPLAGRPRWLVSRVAPDGRSLELRLLEPQRPARGELLASAPSPYLAFLASLALPPSEALVVGPEVSPDPDYPFVRSLVLRLSTTCT